MAHSLEEQILFQNLHSSFKDFIPNLGLEQPGGFHKTNTEIE